MMGKSQVFSNQRGRLPRGEAADLADLILGEEKARFAVNIIFTDDEEISELNRRFRHKEGPTDVLAFPADPDLEVLGDIFVSIDTARRQASEYGQSLRDEILRLVCHGTLHLCGYDHHRAREAAIMRQKEEFYLSELANHA